MEILLKQISLKNFKGIKDLTIDFGEMTNISGENATGKTTIFDSFCWLLFGKDSKGRSSFEVQTLDNNNNVIHGIDCNVTAILSIDGVEKVISKTLSEKWVKQRGQAESELKGTTTNYEIDGVPTKLKDYQAFINSIINEDLFKMITNPIYFPTMKWQDQRKILLEIIGDIDDEKVINYNDKLAKLNGLLIDGIDNFNKRIKASISKLKEQVKSIPFRIDECNNSIVEIDTEALEFQKRTIVGSINSIDEQIADKSKANETKIELQNKLFKAKDKKRELEASALEAKNKPLNEVKSKIASKEDAIRVLLTSIEGNNLKIGLQTSSKNDYENEIHKKEQQQADLRAEWEKVNNNTFEFDESATICPCCGRAYDMEKIAEIKLNAQDNFNNNKSSVLLEIQFKGKKLGDDIQKLLEGISVCEDEFQFLTNKNSEYADKISCLKGELLDLEKQKEVLSYSSELDIPGRVELLAEIDHLESELRSFKSDDNTELKSKKKELQDKLEEINKQLNSKDNNTKLLARIEELKQEEKDLNIKMAELEGQQFLGEEFIRTKVELLEGEINKKFNGAVAFKLFNQQVNGGLNECCEALVDGVPFGNVNTAGQINAGLSIIKTLCEHYNVQAPIFIDNRESVNNIVDFNGQIINLKVSKDKKLKVEVQE